MFCHFPVRDWTATAGKSIVSLLLLLILLILTPTEGQVDRYSEDVGHGDASGGGWLAGRLMGEAWSSNKALDRLPVSPGPRVG